MGSDELQFHAFCLTDTGTRLDQYAHALRASVREGDVVVDLGAGTGILSFLACAAGARRVYAIEASPSIEYGRLLAAAGGYDDRVHFIHSPSSLATLPERADVIVADIHDTFGLQSTGLSTILDARDRFLKPEGRLIPARIELFAAAVEAHDLYRKTVELWRQHVHGIDLSPLRHVAVNELYPGRFRSSQLLSTVFPIASVDLTCADSLHLGGSALLSAGRRGTIHGVCGCFVTTLSDGIAIGNIPGDTQTTNFAQSFFPIDSPHSVEQGDTVMISIDVFDGSQARWQVRVTRGEATTRFDHATFHSTAMDRGRFEKYADAYHPRLTAHGAMERALLDTFDGSSSALELEQWLAERFAAQLPSPRAAAAFLKATIDRCG